MIVIGGLGTRRRLAARRRLLRRRFPKLLRGFKDAPGLDLRHLADRRRDGAPAGRASVGRMPRGGGGRMERSGWRASPSRYRRSASTSAACMRCQDVSFARRRGRDRRPDRPERRRQEHAAQLRLGHHAADHRHGAASARRPARGPTAPTRWRGDGHRPGVPASAADRRAERARQPARSPATGACATRCLPSCSDSPAWRRGARTRRAPRSPRSRAASASPTASTR